MSYEDYIKSGPVMVPAAGALIYDRDGERVEGLTVNELVNKLTDLRAANHKRIGDPVQDVKKAMAKNPQFTSAIPVKELTKPRRRLELIERINSWLSNRREKLKTLTYVSPTEASKRAAICAGCKFNRDWRGCRSCGGESMRIVERETVILSQNKRTVFHNRLLGCDIAGHEGRLAVFLTEEFLRHRVNYLERLPSHCWLKDLSEKDSA